MSPARPRPRPVRSPAAVSYHVPRARRRWPVVAVGSTLLLLLAGGQLAVTGPDSAPVAGPAPEPTGSSEPSGTPSSAAASAQPSVGDGIPIDDVTVQFTVGAVLDDQARAVLAEAAVVLAAPDAAPVLVTGHAEPGADRSGATRLAASRAAVVIEALVESGVPIQLLRADAVVDGDSGRTVRLAPDTP